MYYNSKLNLVILKSYKTASQTLHVLLKKYATNKYTDLHDQHYGIDNYLNSKGLKFEDVRIIIGVRNPWDCLSSWYHWHVDYTSNRTYDTYSMKEFLESNQDHWRRNITRLEVDRFDDVIIFEQLQKSINYIGEKYGLTNIIDKPLPHEHKSSNFNIDYRDFYDDETRQYVKEAFKERIQQLEDKFGIRYSFDKIIENV